MGCESLKYIGILFVVFGLGHPSVASVDSDIKGMQKAAVEVGKIISALAGPTGRAGKVSPKTAALQSDQVKLLRSFESLRRSQTQMVCNQSLAPKAEGEALLLANNFRQPSMVSRIILNTAADFVSLAYGNGLEWPIYDFFLGNATVLANSLTEKISDNLEVRTESSEVLRLAYALEAVELVSEDVEGKLLEQPAYLFVSDVIQDIVEHLSQMVALNEQNEDSLESR